MVKRAFLTVLMQCTGVWFAGGKFGLSWKAIQIRADKIPERIRGFAFLDDGESAEASAPASAVPVKRSAAAPPPQNQFQELDDEDEAVDDEEALAPPSSKKVSAPPPTEDEEEEEAEEVAPAPVPAKAVVKKLVKTTKVVAKK
jgi:hypothetical protein